MSAFTRNTHRKVKKRWSHNAKTSIGDKKVITVAVGKIHHDAKKEVEHDRERKRRYVKAGRAKQGSHIHLSFNDPLTHDVAPPINVDISCSKDILFIGNFSAGACLRTSTTESAN